MKPDFNCINTILTKGLERSRQGEELSNSDFEPEMLEKVSLQILLLQHGGYIEAEIEPRLCDDAPADFRVKGLTFEGHSLLKLMQDDSMWSKTVQLIESKGLEPDFETVRVAVAAIINEMLA